MILRWLADRGPWVLVAGIAAGLALPGLARFLVPYIPHMVAGLLFLSALRIGPQRMRASLQGNLAQSIVILAVIVIILLFVLIIKIS